MLRNLRRIRVKKLSPIFIQKQSFLTNEYKCVEAWNSQISSPILTKVNLNDFYNILDQNFASKGVISAIDVDIFANAIRDPMYLEELKDLLHKLRCSAETGNTLESTHHATIRNFIEFDHVQELIDILRDPLNFGLFLDHYTANILMDKLIITQDYEKAAKVAGILMLQEDFSNQIMCALSQYACFKFIEGYTPPEPQPVEHEKNKKVEEVKIRIKYLRNPYYDDHFDIKDTLTLAGKTLAWTSETLTDNVSNNLQLIGWLYYKKYDKLTKVCETLIKSKKLKVFPETLNIIKNGIKDLDEETKKVLDTFLTSISSVQTMETSLEEALKNSIENAINKVQTNDISQQKQLFNSWVKIREDKLEEQSKRLDRAKRIQLIEEKQKELKDEEQKLWFFENEEAIDLEIEKKEKLMETPTGKKSTSKENDDDYIPPEILPKRK